MKKRSKGGKIMPLLAPSNTEQKRTKRRTVKSNPLLKISPEQMKLANERTKKTRGYDGLPEL